MYGLANDMSGEVDWCVGLYGLVAVPMLYLAVVVLVCLTCSCFVSRAMQCRVRSSLPGIMSVLVFSDILCSVGTLGGRVYTRTVHVCNIKCLLFVNDHFHCVLL